VAVGSALVVLAGAAIVPFIHLEFLPEFHETNVIMHMYGAPGVGLDETMRVGAAAQRALLAVPGVQSVAQFVGRATLAEDHGFGAERSELLVRLHEGDAGTVAEALRARAATIGGFTFD
jgi:Cu/Ag efflux pump CusA